MDRLQRSTLVSSASLGDALKQLGPGAGDASGRRKTTCFQVVSPTGELVGLLTETDIMRAAVAAVGDVALEPIARFVKPVDKLICISDGQYGSTPSADISCLMAHNRIKHLPVVGADLRPVGVIDSLLAASDLHASMLASGAYSEEYGGRLVLGVQSRSTPLFVPENMSVRQVAQRMLEASCTAAVVHKADDARGQTFLYGLVTMSDIIKKVLAVPEARRKWHFAAGRGGIVVGDVMTHKDRVLNVETGNYSFMDVIKTMVDGGFRHMPIVRFTKQSLFGRTRRNAGIVVQSLLDVVDANTVLTSNRSIPAGLGTILASWGAAPMKTPETAEQAVAPLPSAGLPTPRPSAAGTAPPMPRSSTASVGAETPGSSAMDPAGVGGILPQPPVPARVPVSEGTHRIMRRINKLCDAPATEENLESLDSLLGNLAAISTGLLDEWRSSGTADQLAACVVVSSLQASALRTAAMWTIMQRGIDGCDEALSRITHAWQQLSLIRVLFNEAGARDVAALDLSGYPTDRSRLAPGTTVSVVCGENTLPVPIAPRFSECLLLEQFDGIVRFQYHPRPVSAAPPDASRALHALRALFSALCTSDALDVVAVATTARASDAPRDACDAAERLQQIAQTASEMLAVALPRAVIAAAGNGSLVASSSSSPAWAAPVEAAAELISGAVWTPERLTGCIEALQAYVDVRRQLLPITQLGWSPESFETPAQASLGRGCAAVEASELQPLDLPAAASLLCTLLAAREAKALFSRKPIGMALKPCVQLLSRCSGVDVATVTADVWTQVSTLASALLPADAESAAKMLGEFRRQGARDSLQWQRVAAAVQTIECATSSEAVAARAIFVLLHSALAVSSVLGPLHEDVGALVADARDAAVVAAQSAVSEGTVGSLVTRAGSSTAVGVDSLRSSLPKPCKIAFGMFSIVQRQLEARPMTSVAAGSADVAAEELPGPSACAGSAPQAACSGSAVQTPRRSSGPAMAVSVSLGMRPAQHLGTSAKLNLAA